MNKNNQEKIGEFYAAHGSGAIEAAAAFFSPDAVAASVPLVWYGPRSPIAQLRLLAARGRRARVDRLCVVEAQAA
jgi:hypothetical protein